VQNDTSTFVFLYFVYISLYFLQSTYTITHVLVSEGLAVGVAFGAIGKSATATFENARWVKLAMYWPYKSVHDCSTH